MGKGEVQQIFSYPPLRIQTNPMPLVFTLTDTRIQTTLIQLNPMRVESIWTLDYPNPFPGLVTWCMFHQMYIYSYCNSYTKEIRHFSIEVSINDYEKK